MELVQENNKSVRPLIKMQADQDVVLTEKDLDGILNLLSGNFLNPDAEGSGRLIQAVQAGFKSGIITTRTELNNYIKNFK